jgi:predicted esterase
MRSLIRNFTFYVTFLAALAVQSVMAQSVLDPSDPVINYDPAHPPSPPGWLQMGKWVRTPNTAVKNRNNGWTADNYKCYNWQGMAFRLRFPKNYATTNDGKKYPLIIFLHGKGEIAKPPLLTNGQNYDNEFQLLQGPYEFEQAILNNTWNGYVLAPQVTDLFYDGDFVRIMEIVDYMIANNKVDPFNIMVDGLSSGGLASWQLFNRYPLYISSASPISPPVQLDIPYWPYNKQYIDNKKYTPIWITQGGTDTNPTPAVTAQLQDSMLKYGANFKRTVYPTLGHVNWYSFWSEPDFWPFINRSYMSNPWPLFGKDQFWPGEPVSATIGVMPGFDGYEWRYNGTLITGQNDNEIHVTNTGVYSARINKGGLWSEWSRIPVTVKNNNYRIEAEDWTTMSGVQLQKTQDTDGNLNVTGISNGDWMEYSVSPYLPGTYTLKMRLAASSSGAKLQILDGTTVLTTVNVPRTFGSQTWQTVTLSLSLPAGQKTLRIKSTSNTSFNFNWMEFSLAVAEGTLPVKFVYFNAQCGGSTVGLQWKTAQEQNTERFSVQRSSDGVNWSEIGSVAAAGQSSTERSYSYQDRSGSGGSSLYRIVEYDYSGQSTISSIVRSNCTSGKNQVSLYPNPSSGNSALNVTLEQAAQLRVQVVDSKGAVLQQKQVLLPSGSSTIPLNMESYARGVYSITVQYNEEVKTLKFIKK